MKEGCKERMTFQSIFDRRIFDISTILCAIRWWLGYLIWCTVYNLYLDLTINSSSDYRRSIPQKDLEVSEHICSIRSISSTNFNNFLPFHHPAAVENFDSRGGFGQAEAFHGGPKLPCQKSPPPHRKRRKMEVSLSGWAMMKSAPKGWLFSG